MSRTCRLLRNLCTPFIFRSVTRTIITPIVHRDVFLPRSLWPYVRELIIVDRCEDRAAGEGSLISRLLGVPRSPGSRLRYADDPYTCGVVGGNRLGSILRHIPLLCSLKLIADAPVIHGVSWSFVRTNLKLPTLRSLYLCGLIPSPTRLPSDNLNIKSKELAPLTFFSYTVTFPRKPCPFPAEEEALALILSRLHGTLQTLILPSEPAPMQSMFKWGWPRLRELRLRGAQRTTPGVPLFSLLSCMPQLRILVVELTLSSGEEQRCFWPADDRLTPFPCPELEQLTLANPVVHD
ncbi:hypothetical protein C8Q74DRAFT_638548 [Fomes fomentarius]|nr:hypothetical protein C8Q74DRAFT_638548 [Fomes fomentarius]